jgi:hypothetical protein
MVVSIKPTAAEEFVDEYILPRPCAMSGEQYSLA